MALLLLSAAKCKLKVGKCTKENHFLLPFGSMLGRKKSGSGFGFGGKGGKLLGMK